MLLLDLSLPTAAENLALDEALLESVEDQPAALELLRLWECPQTAVVLGRSCAVTPEVNLLACEEANVPVLRRTSGGGTVVIGPGCLLYSLRLSYERRPQLQMLDQAHCFVLSTIARALNALLGREDVRPRGTSDLAINDQKISGNSVRCKRDFLLYHGTLLYDFDLTKVQHFLLPPPRQPEYRAGREHWDFVTNLSLDADSLRQSLAKAWQADEPLQDLPDALMQELLARRYQQREWNFER
jgi:lipoate---protein ligase